MAAGFPCTSCKQDIIVGFVMVFRSPLSVVFATIARGGVWVSTKWCTDFVLCHNEVSKYWTRNDVVFFSNLVVLKYRDLVLVIKIVVLGGMEQDRTTWVRKVIVFYSMVMTHSCSSL